MAKMKPYVFAIMVSFLGGQSFAMPALQPCTTATYARPDPAPATSEDGNPSWLQPVPTNQTGCLHGLRMSAGTDLTIWRCQVVLPEGQEFAEGQSEYAFLIQHKDKPLQEYSDALMAGAYQNFEIVTVDLDDDGQRENILAAWNGQSNGLGVHSWTIYVFDAQWSLIQRFNEVADWGDSNLVSAPAGRSGCDIAITSYVEDISLRRGEGLALRAQFFSLSAQTTGPSLISAAERDAVQRRLTNSLMRQRTAWFSEGEDTNVWQWRGNVAAWLNHPSTIRARN
jgi:hypothetical protein